MSKIFFDATPPGLRAKLSDTSCTSSGGLIASERSIIVKWIRSTLSLSAQLPTNEPNFMLVSVAAGWSKGGGKKLEVAHESLRKESGD